jgi:hypothetical protein
MKWSLKNVHKHLLKPYKIGFQIRCYRQGNDGNIWDYIRKFDVDMHEMCWKVIGVSQEHRIGQCAYNVTLFAFRLTIDEMEKAEMPTVCIVELLVTVIFIKSIECCTEMLLWRVHVADNNKKYFCLHVKCKIFLSDSKRIGFCRQIFNPPPPHTHTQI